MANIKSFPNNQDEYIGAQEVMRWHHGRTSGVFAAEGNAQVTAVLDQMAVQVSDGNGWLSNDNSDGIVWWIDTEKETGSKLQIPVEMADATLPRIDRVVVSWETTNYVALPEIIVLKGTPAGTPAYPNLTNNNILRQISLAAIHIPAGAMSIDGSMITDERLDNTVCGLVTETIEADTTSFYYQLSESMRTFQGDLTEAFNAYVAEAENFQNLSKQTFEQWFADLQAELSGDVATNLQNQINNKQSWHIPVAVTIAVSDWDAETKQCTKTVTGVAANSSILATPAPESYVAYGEAQVRAVAHAENSITFACDYVPNAAVTANLMIMGVNPYAI